MTTLSERLLARYYAGVPHPYKPLENKVNALLGDGSLAARVVPNRLHGRIVKVVEGREEEDTFPTAYKTNTRAAVDRLAAASGFEVESFDYLSQYPNYLMFNGLLFLVGTGFEKLISRFQALKFLRGWIMVTLVRR